MGSRSRPERRLRAVHQAGDDVGLNGEGVGCGRPHDLRHSFVSNAFEFATVAEVSALARHANPKVTLAVYAGLTGDGREKAATKLVEGGFGS